MKKSSLGRENSNIESANDKEKDKVVFDENSSSNKAEGKEVGANSEAGNKKRHGCVTAWLILMIISNSLSAILYLFAGDMISLTFPGGLSNLMLIFLTILTIGNVVCSVLLFKWMKLGFWGFVVTSIGAIIININIGLGIVQSLVGLLGLVILYGILQIKSNNISAWDQLD